LACVIVSDRLYAGLREPHRSRQLDDYCCAPVAPVQ
jgi:hypothetical protein